MLWHVWEIKGFPFTNQPQRVFLCSFNTVAAYCGLHMLTLFYPEPYHITSTYVLRPTRDPLFILHSAVYVYNRKHIFNIQLCLPGGNS